MGAGKNISRHIGEKNPKARLTVPLVRGIKALKGTGTRGEIAKRYGVGSQTIGDIWRGRTWRHVV